MPSTAEERETTLRDYAIKLYDKGDGRAVDWAKVAETLMKVGFSCIDELPPTDDRAQQVVRRVHGGAYNRMAGTPDDGTPYTADRAERPPFSPGGPAPEHDFDLRR